MHVTLYLAAIAIALSSQACGQDKADVANAPDAGVALTPGSLAAITSEAQSLLFDPNVLNWHYAPGWPGKQEFGGSHGSVKEIFVNERMHDAASSDTPLMVWPDEAIVVKFAYEKIDDVEPLARFIMWKRQGLWYYWEAHSNPDLSGGGIESPSCKRCHTSDDSHDAIVAFPLPIR